MKKIIFVISAILLVTFVTAYSPDLSQGTQSFPSLDNAALQYILKGGDSTTGTYNFNGGWQSNGLSIIDGDIYAQTGYFYNITSLNVTKQNLTVNDNLLVFGNFSVDPNTFFVNSVTHRVGIGTLVPTGKLDVRGPAFTSQDIIKGWAGGNRVWDVGADASNNGVAILGNGSGVNNFVFNSASNSYIYNIYNFGIGTTNPKNKLNVIGDGNFTTTLSVGIPSAPTNITLYSPDGTQYSCGVLNGGTFACS